MEVHCDAPENSRILLFLSKWLQQLGTVACNWKNLTMDFTWAGQPRHLQGICSQPIEPLSLKSISKELRHNSTAFAICLENSTATLPEHLHPNMPASVNSLRCIPEAE
ncbi:hypothetical protein P3X46_025743 [Hevea brasiliensis]|uniref:Uncharacterized protein n=1 Tax=Hevea brasiliensis TaxID=3981 RepID=A0ABQ9L6N2_HEVBR|nr:hypothetical protein P3X46_025743 [Hevea brasiliensis]